MNKFCLLIGWVATLLGPLGAVALAQSVRVERGIHSMHQSRGCVSLERLALSASQHDAIKQIEMQQKGRILSYQQDLMIKRIELRDLIRDGQIAESFVMQKSEDLEVAQRQLSAEMMVYQLAIRRILTPEQLSSWCTLIGGTNSHGGWMGHE